jgi:hypothetical protein
MLGYAGEPLAGFGQSTQRITMMGTDVLPGDVGDEFLIAVRFHIKDQAPFVALLDLGGKRLGTEEQA